MQNDEPTNRNWIDRRLSRRVELVYNWWTLFVRLTHPHKHFEAISSRLLLHGVATQTKREGFATLDGLKNVTKGWLGTGFVVHPGTPLYDIAILEGRITGISGNEPYLYLSDKLPSDFAEQIQRFCAEHPAWYSRYDRLNDDYMAMVRQVSRESIRNHWAMQKPFGEIRRKKYREGQLSIYPHVEFQRRIDALGGG